MCLAQGYDTVTPIRFEPTAPRSRVKHSTTELITVICCWLTKRDSDQSPQLQRLARKNENSLVASFDMILFQKANNKSADQTALMRWLFCAFVVRKHRRPVFSLIRLH